MDSQHGHGDNPDSRTRVLTDSGLELYNANIRTHLKKIELVQTEVELCLERFSTTNSEDYETVLEIQKTLNLCHCKYSLYSEEYLKYLRNTRTEDSLRIAEEHKKEDLKYKDIIERALQQTKVSDRHETSSQFTHRSGAHSRASSNSSSVALIKRAKAEAAQVKLEFALKEAEMQKQKAYIEEQEKILKAKSITKKAELAAEIELLNYKKEAAAAVAEAEALQHEQSAFGSKKSDVILAKTAFDRTRQYVEQQGDQVLAADHNVNTLHNPFVNLVVGDACDESRNWPTFKQTPKPSHPKYGVRSVSIVHNDNDNNTKTLNPEALTFQPETAAINQNVATDITRFLMKKDLLLSRLTPYNDKAEMYAVWKASFKNIIGELSVSALEELELMGKWLGPESTKHANSIRSANINNPAKGLQRLWDRLDERYGSSEAVEASLMAKLNSFPKLTQKDNKRLYELSDILCEIESVKEDSRYQALLAYFDSSSGVLPILNKLPYNIQEKWTTRASHYKREKQVTFPPFTFFVKFIRELSQIKNDPSFAYDQTIQTKKVFNNDKPAFRTAISVRKTEISSDLDLQKQCLIHKT